jgi:hypothetical protein
MEEKYISSILKFTRQKQKIWETRRKRGPLFFLLFGGPLGSIGLPALAANCLFTLGF